MEAHAVKPPGRLGRVRARVEGMLRDGVEPRQLALSLAVGMVVGIFPVMGTTTVLGLAAAWALRLNHAAVQLVNYAVSPIQPLMVLAFVRAGERLVGAPPLPLVPSEAATAFRADPAAFVARFGEAGLHGVLAWSIAAPLVATALTRLLRPALAAIAARTGAR